ncbi:MAG: tetratricopeptide repeat protein [Promethearchaeota archaeon]
MNKIETLEFLFEKSRFGEGLTKIEYFEKQKNLEIKERIRIQIIKIRFCEKLGLYQEGLELARNLLQKDNIKSNPFFEIDTLIEMYKILFSMGRIEQIKKNIANTEENLLLIQTDNENAILERMASLIILRMGCHWQNGELDNALFYAKFNLEIRSKLHKRLDLANAYNNVGVMYNARGDLTKSLSFLRKAFNIYSEINSTRGLSKTGSNIGAILIQLGQLKESLKFMERSLEIDYSSGYIDGIKVASQNIGEVYWHMGKYHKALSYLHKSYDISMKSRDIFQISESIVPLIAVLLELSKFKEAEKLLFQMTQIKNITDNKIVLQRFYLTNAMILKKSQIKKKGSLQIAEENLRNIVEDKVRYHDITVNALVMLCEILLNKIGINDNPLVIKDINKNLSKLIKIAKDTNSYSILVESLLLKAKMALLDFNFVRSQEFLINALKIVNRNSLQRIKLKILKNIDFVLKNFSFWNNISKEERIIFKKKQLNTIKSQIRSFFSSIKVEEKNDNDNPYMFIILHYDGRIIISQDFSKQSKKDDLKLKILQVDLYKNLRNFINNSVDFAQFEKYKILFTKIGKVIACYIYNGSSLVAVKKLNKLAKILIEQRSLLENLSETTQTAYNFDLITNKSLLDCIKSVFSAPVGAELL